jgi:hypothetical protein
VFACVLDGATKVILWPQESVLDGLGYVLIPPLNHGFAGVLPPQLNVRAVALEPSMQLDLIL